MGSESTNKIAQKQSLRNISKNATFYFGKPYLWKTKKNKIRFLYSILNYGIKRRFF